MTARRAKLGTIVASRSLLVVCGLMVNALSSYAGQQTTPGHSIGQVSVAGDLIVIELE